MTVNDPELYRQAYDVLTSLYGLDAAFRDGQYEAIEATMVHHRTLVVQRTGWGKSLVYFIATKLLRSNRAGVTLVVSPLLPDHAGNPVSRGHPITARENQHWIICDR